MSNGQMTNLDIQCAELGRQLANISDMEEKIINAALTVLEEQGLYAMFLYLKARHSSVADRINSAFLQFLQTVFGDKLNEANDMLNATRRLAEDLDDLLFVRDLLRTALSYARYHLKARSGGSS